MRLSDQLRFASRRLAARPALTATLVALSGLGIGVCAAAGALVDSLVVRPLPFAQSDRLVRIQTTRGFTRELLQAWRSNPAFRAVEEFSPPREVMLGSDRKLTAIARSISPGLLHLLDARPVAGRLFDTADVGSEVVLLSERAWRRAFGADPEIVGRRISLADDAPVVIGIVSSSFSFPDPDTVAWTPLDPASDPLGQVVAAVAPGVPLEDAEAVARSLTASAHLKLSPREFHPSFRSLVPALDDRTRSALALAGAAVAILFLTCCLNAGGLVLADLRRRQNDVAIAVALGANRRQVLGPLLIEHLLISGGSLVVGLPLAEVLVRGAAAALPAAWTAASLNPIDLDPRALTLAAGLTTSAAVLAGGLPVWVATRWRFTAGRLGRRGSRSPASSRLADALSSLQVAFAFILLLAAALLARSFFGLAGAERGLDVSNVEAGTVILSPSVETPEGFRAAALVVRDRLAAVPGVTDVAMSTIRPGRRPFAKPQPVEAEPSGISAEVAIDHYGVTPEFFRLYGMSPVRGRLLRADDPADAAVVSARLARLLWPAGDPIGGSFGFLSVRYHVVGVVREVTLPSLDRDLDRPEFFSAFQPLESFSFQVRCRLDCGSVDALTGTIRAESQVRRVDAVRLQDEFDAEEIQPRRTAAAGAICAAFALLISLAGSFSVLSFNVAQRTREFGVRAALGAAPRDLRGLIVARAARITVIGVVLAAPFAWIAVKGLSAIEFRVGPSDAPSWALAVVTTGAIGLTAAWRPARSAGRTDPARLLRTE